MASEPPSTLAESTSTPTGESLLQRDARRAAQHTLLHEHQELTARIRDITNRFRKLVREETADGRARRTRMLALLEEEMQLLEQTHALDAVLRRLYTSHTRQHTHTR